MNRNIMLGDLEKGLIMNRRAIRACMNDMMGMDPEAAEPMAEMIEQITEMVDVIGSRPERAREIYANLVNLGQDTLNMVLPYALAPTPAIYEAQDNIRSALDDISKYKVFKGNNRIHVDDKSWGYTTH